MKDELVEVTQAVNDHCTCAELEGENPDCALHGVTTAWALENLLPSDWQECVIKLRQRASSPVEEAPADVAGLVQFLRGHHVYCTARDGRFEEAAAVITRLSADLADARKVIEPVATVEFLGDEKLYADDDLVMISVGTVRRARQWLSQQGDQS